MKNALDVENEEKTPGVTTLECTAVVMGIVGLVAIIAFPVIMFLK